MHKPIHGNGRIVDPHIGYTEIPIRFRIRARVNTFKHHSLNVPDTLIRYERYAKDTVSKLNRVIGSPVCIPLNRRVRCSVYERGYIV